MHDVLVDSREVLADGQSTALGEFMTAVDHGQLTYIITIECLFDIAEGYKSGGKVYFKSRKARLVFDKSKKFVTAYGVQ